MNMDLLIAAGAGILLASGIGIWLFLRRCDKAEQELHELLKEEERKEKATLTAHLKEKVARQNAECALRSKRSLMESVSQEVLMLVSGIPKKLQKKVFEALPDTGYEQKKTGLILMVCRTLVRLLEGVIYIDPHYENGTSVVFSIKI